MKSSLTGGSLFASASGTFGELESRSVFLFRRQTQICDRFRVTRLDVTKYVFEWM